MKIMKKQKKEKFTALAEFCSQLTGKAWVFISSFLLVIVWIISGPFFNFSNTWQLIINSVSSAVTFLMVFIIQHSQNRETKILNLKLDEIIKAISTTSKSTLDLENLSDKDLQILESKYKQLKNKK